MTELVCELIITLDGFARGQHSPAYYGYSDPDFDDWINTNTAIRHRMLIGHKTYEMLNGLPAEVRDEGWNMTTTNPGRLHIAIRSRSFMISAWRCSIISI